MKYSDYQNNPTSLRALTGLNLVQFNELLSFFQDAHDEYWSQVQMNGKRRKQLRRFVIYANSPLPSIEERLFFILVYFINNPLQEYHAACFGMGQKHRNTFIHGLTHILELSLKQADVMPASTDKELSALHS